MRSDIHPPGVPPLEEWKEAMDEVLVRSVRPGRVRPRRRMVGRLSRWARSMARPIGHGIATLGAAAVAISTALPPMAAVEPPPGTEPAIVAADLAPDTLIPASAVAAFEAATPRSQLHRLLAPEDSSRLPHDIDLVQRGLTDKPPSNARAVPTPEGGGLTTVTLRPTVR